MNLEDNLFSNGLVGFEEFHALWFLLENPILTAMALCH